MWTMDADYLILTHSVVFESLNSFTRIYSRRENVVQPKFSWENIHHHMDGAQMVLLAQILMGIFPRQAHGLICLLRRFFSIVEMSIKHI